MSKENLVASTIFVCQHKLKKESGGYIFRIKCMHYIFLALLSDFELHKNTFAYQFLRWMMYLIIQPKMKTLLFLLLLLHHHKISPPPPVPLLLLYNLRHLLTRFVAFTACPYPLSSSRKSVTKVSIFSPKPNRYTYQLRFETHSTVATPHHTPCSSSPHCSPHSQPPPTTTDQPTTSISANNSLLTSSRASVATSKTTGPDAWWGRVGGTGTSTARYSFWPVLQQYC